MKDVINNYINQFEPEIREKLEKLCLIIREEAPEVRETFSYQMPTFKLKRNLVHFAVNKHHIGLYPTPSAVEHFKVELKDYEHSRGAIRFPLDKQLPEELIRKIVAFRVNEENAKF